MKGSLFLLQSEDDSGNDSDSSERSGKRKRFDDEAIEKRREKRLWDENRFVLYIYTHMVVLVKSKIHQATLYQSKIRDKVDQLCTLFFPAENIRIFESLYVILRINWLTSSTVKTVHKQKGKLEALFINVPFIYKGIRGRDRMVVVGFTTTCAISAYHH